MIKWEGAAAHEYMIEKIDGSGQFFCYHVSFPGQGLFDPNEQHHNIKEQYDLSPVERNRHNLPVSGRKPEEKVRNYWS